MMFNKRGAGILLYIVGGYLVVVPVVSTLRLLGSDTDNAGIRAASMMILVLFGATLMLWGRKLRWRPRDVPASELPPPP